MTFATLGPGSYVGESCLLEVSERTASVYAVGYVDTYVISNESFFRVSLLYIGIFLRSVISCVFFQNRLLRNFLMNMTIL